MALIIASISAGARGVRRRYDELQMRSIDIGIQQFEKDHGFLPPLVDADTTVGGGPLLDYTKQTDSNNTVLFGCVRPVVPVPTRNNAPRGRLKIAGFQEADAGDADAYNKFIRNEIRPDAPKFSFLSLGAYLTGSLPAEVDGAGDGLMGKPFADGTFSDQAQKVRGKLDTTAFQDRMRVRQFDAGASGTGVTQADATINVLVDRNLVSIRYYRWAPLLHVGLGSPVPTGRADAAPNNINLAGQVRDDNTPYIFGWNKTVGSAPSRAALRATAEYQNIAKYGYALMAAGPDALFGGTNDVSSAAEVADNISVAGGTILSEGLR